MSSDVTKRPFKKCKRIFQGTSEVSRVVTFTNPLAWMSRGAARGLQLYFGFSKLTLCFIRYYNRTIKRFYFSANLFDFWYFKSKWVISVIFNSKQKSNYEEQKSKSWVAKNLNCQKPISQSVCKKGTKMMGKLTASIFSCDVGDDFWAPGNNFGADITQPLWRSEPSLPFVDF